MTVSATGLRNRLLSRARLRHLQVFAKVAELQTVKRAAEAIGITQPTATQALADLEQLLELPLFLRHAQGMRLTPAGQTLLPLARKALALMDDTATQAAALAQGSLSVVRVAAIAAAVGGPLGRTLPPLAAQQPGLWIQLQEADATRQAALVADGEIDCAICRLPAVLPQGWSFTPLWADRFVIIGAPDHPLVQRRPLSLAELQQATWLITPTSMVAREALDALFADAPDPVRPYSVITASAPMVWSLLTRAPLLALVPATLVERLLESGQLVELPWPAPRPLGPIGVLAPTLGRSPALSCFLQLLAQVNTAPLDTCPA